MLTSGYLLDAVSTKVEEDDCITGQDLGKYCITGQDRVKECITGPVLLVKIESQGKI